MSRPAVDSLHEEADMASYDMRPVADHDGLPQGVVVTGLTVGAWALALCLSWGVVQLFGFVLGRLS
jgi:hypothetical protein